MRIIRLRVKIQNLTWLLAAVAFLFCCLPVLTRPAIGAQDIDVSTPEIEAVRASLTWRAESLFPLLDGGQIGIAYDGMLKIRSTEGLGLRQLAMLHRLVEEDNRDRLALYRDIALANGFPEKVPEVQAIFADSWRARAAPGWFLETDAGNWVRK